MTKTRCKPRRRMKLRPLGTIREIPDNLWAKIRPILRESWPKKPTGRRTADWRAALNGIIFRMRTGCQWEQLPRKFGPKGTVHDWFRRRCAGGVTERIWAVLVQECDELGAVDWPWQSADAAPGKARFGGERGGQGSHRSRENGHQEVGAGRWRRRPPGGSDRWGQRPGAADAACDDRSHRGRASRTDGGAGATLELGRGIR
jgi:transposase